MKCKTEGCQKTSNHNGGYCSPHFFALNDEARLKRNAKMREYRKNMTSEQKEAVRLQKRESRASNRTPEDASMRLLKAQKRAEKQRLKARERAKSSATSPELERETFPTLERKPLFLHRSSAIIETSKKELVGICWRLDDLAEVAGMTKNGYLANILNSLVKCGMIDSYQLSPCGEAVVIFCTKAMEICFFAGINQRPPGVLDFPDQNAEEEPKAKNSEYPPKD